MSQHNTELPFYPEDLCGGARTQELMINSLIGRTGTITICKVVKVKEGEVAPVGLVDILPMVLQVDGAGNPFKSAVIYNVPYMRYQGGENAVIVDPKVGDIGICLIASRDISNIKATKDSAAPASKRQYDIADSLYIGVILNGTPTQYIHFLEKGINIVSTGIINAKGTKIILDAPVETTSTIQAADNILDMTAIGNGETMQIMRDKYNEHTHVAIGLGAPTSTPTPLQET